MKKSKKLEIEIKEESIAEKDSLLKDCYVTLDGGGTFGVHHIGVVKALSESGFNIKKISAASMGAIVGFALKTGKLKEIINFFAEIQTFFDLADPKDILLSPYNILAKGGVFSQDKGRDIFRKYISKQDYEASSDIELIVSAVNYNTGKLETFSSKNHDYDSFLECVCASWAIPGVFHPVKIGNDYYLDGSIREDVPLKALCSLPDYNEKTIHFVSLCEPNMERWEGTPSIFTSLMRTQLILFDEISSNDVETINSKYLKKNLCFIKNNSNLMKFHLDFNNLTINKTISFGYAAAREVLNQ